MRDRLLALLLAVAATLTAAATAAVFPPRGLFPTAAGGGGGPLRNLVRQRAADDDAAVAKGLVALRAGPSARRGVVWYYTGILRNPLTGAPIVGVEGLELARPLGPDGEDATIGNNGTAASFLSRKVFIYTHLHNRSEALTAFRSGKHAPLRPLHPVRELFEKVTVGVTTPTTATITAANYNNSASSTGRPTAYYAEMELPGGRRLRADKLAITRRTGLPVAAPDLFRALLRVPTDGIAAVAGVGEAYEVVGFVRGRPRRPVNRWVSLASPGDGQGVGRSQEYYTLRGGGGSGSSGSGTASSTVTSATSERAKEASRTGSIVSPGSRGKPGSASLRYTRYGEGPSWYSVGRAVASELVATRYATLADAPPHVLKLVAERCPGFFTDADGAPVGAADRGAVAKVLTLENFHGQKDAYDDFKPWYHGVRQWLRKKGSAE